MSNGILSRLTGGGGEELEDKSVKVEIHDVIGELQTVREGARKEKEELDEDSDEEITVPYEEATIVRPTDERVLKKAKERLSEGGAKEIKREVVGKVDNPDAHIDNPAILLDDFDMVIRELHDGILEELEEAPKQHVDAGFRHLADENLEEDAPFPYLIARLDKGFIVGGASPIINNIADALELSDVEREYVRLVYDEAIQMSEGLYDIEGHILLDDVIVVFKDGKL